MIIVSQDKTEIINFDNILSIKLFHDEEDKDCLYELYCCVNAPGDNYILIGTYETEERAKEVLQEMIKLYKYTQREKEESNMYDIKTGVEFYIKDVVEKVYEVPRN